jgi:hypothetical protein
MKTAKLISHYRLDINTLKWILQKHIMRMWMGLRWLKTYLGLILVLATLTFRIHYQTVTTKLCTCALERFSPSVYKSSSISLSNI